MSNDKMKEIREYALGKQGINRYKKHIGINERVGRHKNRTPIGWLNIDWAKPFNDMFAKFRRKALGKIKNKSFLKKIRKP